MSIAKAKIVVSGSNLQSGRIKQKHRTRNALLEAAAELMRQGRVPSIEDIADAAQVSRATAYRYFPTQEHAIAGSAIMQSNMESQQRLESALTVPNVADRLDIVAEEFCQRFSRNEIAYRTLMRLMLERPPASANKSEQGAVRGSRHVHWLEVALSPIKPQIQAQEFERLIAALVAATGFEAFAALRDIALMDPLQASEVMRWTAQALLQSVIGQTKQETHR